MGEGDVLNGLQDVRRYLKYNRKDGSTSSRMTARHGQREL